MEITRKEIIELMNIYIEAKLELLINDTIVFMAKYCNDYQELYEFLNYLESYDPNKQLLVEELKKAIQAQVTEIALNSKKTN